MNITKITPKIKTQLRVVECIFRFDLPLIRNPLLYIQLIFSTAFVKGYVIIKMNLILNQYFSCETLKVEAQNICFKS